MNFKLHTHLDVTLNIVNPELSQTEEILVQRFYQLKTRQDVANLLEVTDQTLIYHLYRNKSFGYKKFSLKKKTGGERLICAPIKGLKILQQKLNTILYLVYKPKLGTHGFVIDRNIYTNAKAHIGKRFVINLDIEDFFPSINFGRVFGMFMSGPYNLAKPAATVIAQICCHENSLPQGAPTSPVISNMICARLDNELQALARKYGYAYTRFADDITLSTNRSLISNDLAKSFELDDKRYLIVGDLLRAVVESNGFKINEKKFRVQDKSHRQAVTGLVVNRKVNLKKGYVKNIRAALHAWETYGPQKAAKKFFEKFDSKQRLRPATSFPKILRGKIEFLKSIKSDRDKSYIRFVNKYNELVYNGKPQLPLDAFEEIIQSVWVVRCGSKTGTAFMLKDYGLVTCEHCINATDPIEVFRYNEYSGPSRKKAQIVKSNKEIDLAVLSFNGIADFPSLKSSSIDSRRGDSVTTIGFPYYISGNPPLPFNGEVRNVALFGSMTRIILTQTLQAGESGGPALNDNNEVVGVIVGGADHPSVTPYVTNYAIIPIKDILSLR